MSETAQKGTTDNCKNAVMFQWLQHV